MVAEADLIGSWTLVGIELLGPGAESQPPPFGGKAQGVLHYVPGGRMIAIVQEAGRPRIEGGAEGAGKRATGAFSAYAGTYEIVDDHLVHHVEFNSFPNDIGVDYIRYPRFEGGLLVLETPLDPGPNARPMRLRWKRMEN